MMNFLATANCDVDDGEEGITTAGANVHVKDNEEEDNAINR